MEQRTDDGLSPYRAFTRAEWAMLRDDTPMTLTVDEVTRLRSMHDRLDMSEVEEIYLPLSPLLSMYVAATQRLVRVQQRFLGTEDAKMPYIIAIGRAVVARREILNGEGWSGVQGGRVPKDGESLAFVSDFFDFSVYLGAGEGVLRSWDVSRFLAFRGTSFSDPKS